MKECSKCKEVKELTEFYKNKKSKIGYQSSCKVCAKSLYHKRKHLYKENIESYRHEHKESIKIQRKDFYDKNKERLLKEKRENYKNDTEKFKKRSIENREKGDKEKRRKYHREYISKRMEDPIFKFKFNIRTTIRNSIKSKGYSKNSKSFDILGVDFITFKKHIERQFDKWMTWENYGKWHLDHIIPIDSADTEDEIIRLNHYTNFRPLEAIENISKSNNIIEGTQVNLGL